MTLQEESQWSEEEEEGNADAEDEEMEEHTEGISDIHAVQEQERSQNAAISEPHLEQQQGHQIDPSYIHVFLLKYVCPVENCGGTMALIFGTDKSQCNMCDHIRSEQEFLEEMQQYQ